MAGLIPVRHELHQALVKGLTFNDTNGQSVNLGNVFDYNDNVPFTIGCWFNIVDSADERCFIGQFGAPGERVMLFETLKTTRFVTISGGTTVAITSSAGAALNGWHAVVATHDGAGNLNLYLFDANGKLLSADSASGYDTGDPAVGVDVLIGNRDANGDNMDGQLAHVFTVAGTVPNAIEARRFALDPPKAVQKWQREFGRVFYHPLEGNTTGVSRDFSGLGNDGTFDGTAPTVGTTLPKRFGRVVTQIQRIPVGDVVAPSGRIMSSLVNSGGLAGTGGIAGQGGGLAG